MGKEVSEDSEYEALLEQLRSSGFANYGVQPK